MGNGEKEPSLASEVDWEPRGFARRLPCLYFLPLGLTTKGLSQDLLPGKYGNQWPVQLDSSKGVTSCQNKLNFHPQEEPPTPAPTLNKSQDQSQVHEVTQRPVLPRHPKNQVEKPLVGISRPGSPKPGSGPPVVLYGPSPLGALPSFLGWPGQSDCQRGGQCRVARLHGDPLLFPLPKIPWAGPHSSGGWGPWFPTLSHPPPGHGGAMMCGVATAMKRGQGT